MKYKEPFAPGHLKHNLTGWNDLQPDSRAKAGVKLQKALAFKKSKSSPPVLNWSAPANVRPRNSRAR